MAQFIEGWKQRAKQLKIEIYAIYLAYRDPRVPWFARIFAACVVGYAFRPIDLIPDPIPNSYPGVFGRPYSDPPGRYTCAEPD